MFDSLDVACHLWYYIRFNGALRSVSASACHIIGRCGSDVVHSNTTTCVQHHGEDISVSDFMEFPIVHLKQ